MLNTYVHQSLKQIGLRLILMIMSILHMRKMWLREVKQYTQDQISGEARV